MAIWYVSGSGSDSSGNGSSGNPWRSPGKALAQCNDGDTIVFRNGPYSLNSTLRITKANTTWVAESGSTPVFDCGYSAALYTNTNEGPFKKKLPTPAAGFDAVILSAAGVTLDGITVQNVPGSAIVPNDNNVTVRNCKVFFTYGSCIKANTPDKALSGLRLINNRCLMSSVNIFDANRAQNPNRDDQNVTGCVKVGNVAGNVLIQGNYIAFGYGEGLNFGKFNKGTAGVNIIEDNTIHDCNHTLLYVNRSWDVIVRHNILFHTGDTPNRWSDGDVSTGLSVTDEGGPDDANWRPSWQESARVSCFNNLVVNTSPLLRHAMQDDPNGVFDDIYFGFNTFAGGPETGITVIDKNGKPVIQALFVFANGADTSNGLFENNVVDTTNAASTSNFQGGALSSAFKFRNNSYGVQPPSNSRMRGDGDQYGDPALASPTRPRLTGSYPEFALSYAAAVASYGTTINPLNYKLTAGSTRAIGKASGGSAFGGLTPPAEPRNRDFFRRARDNAPDNGFHEYESGGPVAPVADFTHVPTGTALLTGTAVAFTDTSVASGTTITGWSWVIKKGGVTQSTLTTQNINYTFGSAGTWTVALTVTTANSQTDTETRTFVISDPVLTPTATAAFTRSPSGTTINQGTTILFTDTSLVTNTTQTGRTWEVRTSPGGTLLASGTNATFSYQFNTAGAFTVKLAITTAAAVSDDETVTITVNPITTPTVTAAFTLDDTTILEGETVTVTANTSAATNTTISGYEWTWGDGATATGATPAHTYNQAGSYTVTLLVNTAAGLTATATATVTVQAIVSGGEGNSVIVPHREAVKTTTGPQTFTVAALGTLVPKAMLVTMTGATGDGPAATGALLCMGATDGGRQWVNTRFSANGLADSDTARRWTDDAVLMSIDGDGAVTGKASLVGFTAGGVTLNISDSFPVGYLAHFTFFAGDDAQVWVGTATGGALDVARPVATGIAQDAVMAVSTWSARDTATTGADMSLGFATAIAQYSIRNEDRDAEATAVTRVRHAPYLATTGSSDSGGYGALEAGGFTSAGFSLTARASAMTGSTVCLLAFRSATGVYLTSDALGTGGTSTHAMPFEAQAVLGVLSSATTPATAVTGAAGETLGFYAGSVHGPAEFTASIAADHGVATTATRSLSENRFEAVKPDGTSLFDGAGTLGANAFTVAWSVAPASAYLALLLAVEVGEDVVADDAPVAAFDSNARAGTVKFLVKFDASPSNPNGGGTLSYLWNFGDGTFSTEQKPWKVYTKPGTYTVALTVTNTNGTSTRTESDYIVARAETFARFRVGPYRSASITEESDNDFPMDRPAEGAPNRAMWGYHTHKLEARYYRLREMTAAEIAAVEPSPDEATVCYEIDGHRLVIIESSGARRYIATTG